MIGRSATAVAHALAVTLALLAGTDAATAQINPYFGPNETGESCAPVVEAVLHNHNIDPDSVEKISYVVQLRNSGFRRARRDVVTGYEAWVRPKGIKGYLVVEMWIDCSVRRIYTRGDYRVHGLRAY